MKIKLKLLITLIVVMTVSTLIAQVESAKPVANATAEKFVVQEEMSAFEFLIKGGFFLIPIALLLFYSLVVMVEKFIYIRKMKKYNKNLLNELKPSIASGNINESLDILAKDKTATGNVLREGVHTLGRPLTEIESNMDKMANIEIGKMEKNLGHLGLIAGIAPTLGFIGTISGVIKIFYSISITENVSIGNISGGLYEKMISSGSGLIVGIIAFAAYHLLNGMIDSFVLNIQKVNLEFVNLIQRPSHGHKTK